VLASDGDVGREVKSSVGISSTALSLLSNTFMTKSISVGKGPVYLIAVFVNRGEKNMTVDVDAHEPKYCTRQSIQSHK
jgi:hypothetical protein